MLLKDSQVCLNGGRVLPLTGLARMVADGFADTANQIHEVRQDVSNLRAEMKADMASKEDIASLRNEIDLMLDRHIGTFRKDYDELSARVKRIDPVRSSATHSNKMLYLIEPAQQITL